MKKIFAVVLAVVFILNPIFLSGCNYQPKYKLVFIEQQVVDDPDWTVKGSIYIAENSNSTIQKIPVKANTISLNINPSNDKIIYVDYENTDNGVYNETIHTISSTDMQDKELVRIPDNILHDDLGVPGTTSISFEGERTFLEAYYFDHLDDSLSISIYELIDNTFTKINHFGFDPGYFFYSDNGGLLIKNAVLIVSWSSHTQNMVYDVPTGNFNTISQQGEDYSQPKFNSNADMYVYSTYFMDKKQVCWVLNLDLEEINLVCQPMSIDRDTTGYNFNSSEHAWSPNGKYLAVSFNPANVEGDLLYLIDIQSKKPKIVAQINHLENLRDIVWSPDSKMVGFASYRYNSNDPFLMAHSCNIYTLSLGGKLIQEYSNPDDTVWCSFEGWLK
ncbi:hypothetical protein A2V49_01115 [candidate division WWE3 bacterium RBG_19FT_COMBO_34_6]|uniref:Dipeptidylpeptidase IV N-terminal domain-containing protein n=1 Tax=candidate division WWE3 bacterium RBG_19FT_COMBO_34_6 TaxID=1802612 RepID=A0A1F4UKW7_UNCKA|nr:MAG: hypothetical protein A2V49_01115 [candidate division WWE3 bacterium RBG_19FT_COMBO_34_6]